MAPPRTTFRIGKIREARNFQSLRRSGGEKGAVLVLVLWVLLAMSLLALSFAAAVRTEVDAARNVVNQKQAYYLTRAGIDYAVYKILEARRNNFRANRQQLDGADEEALPEVFTGDLSLDLAEGSVHVKVAPETGKIHVNRAGPHLIFNLLIMIGVGEEQADIITDSIADWRDEDEMPSDYGAESDYYQSLEEPYYAKNGPFDVPEELLLVRGVSPEIYYGQKGVTADGQRMEFYGLQKYLTTFGRGRRIDVNAAPLPVLAAIPELDYSEAERIEELRDSSPIRNLSEIMEAIPGMSTNVLGNLTVQRNAIVYTLDAEGRLGEGEAVSRIRCVVQVGGRSGKPYTVLYWNEANIEL